MPTYKIQETITRLIEATVTANDAFEARQKFKKNDKYVTDLKVNSVTDQTDIDIQEIVEVI